MSILISNNFFASVGKLQPKEAMLATQFLAKFMENPAHPSLKLERVTKAKDPNLWSGRINQGLRAILHKVGDTWTILHAGRHDPAYQWAERRQVVANPSTGALQIVTTTERAEEVIAAKPEPVQKPPLFDEHADAYLLSLGIPDEWLPTVRKIKSEDVLLEIAEDLPEEVGERLLRLSEGELVTPPKPSKKIEENPDTLRRFFVLEDTEEFRRVLEAPLASWIAFLHPSQRKIAYGDFNGPAKVTGTAGTGKTVVALHRARHLARGKKSTLLTSYVTTLCQNLEKQLGLFCSDSELERITVATVHRIALDIVRKSGRKIKPVGDDHVKKLVDDFGLMYPSGFDTDFLMNEWEFVIQDQGIESWADYRSAQRTGLGFPLKANDRKSVWKVFERVLERLAKRSEMAYSSICRTARQLIESGRVAPPFDAVVVDEAQDLRSQELRFLSKLAKPGPNSFLIVGDAGQRIYSKTPSLSSLGIEVRGRSHILRVNYRTTKEIRQFADAALGMHSDDLDGGDESRSGVRSLLSGPIPQLQKFESDAEQAKFVTSEIKRRIEREGLHPCDFAIFGRTYKSLQPIERSLKEHGVSSEILGSQATAASTSNLVSLATMHRAKGLEFKVVFVIGASHDQLPLPAVYKKIEDPVLREDAIQRERHLFYVSLTRPRDELVVTWVGKPTEFLESVLRT